MRYLLLLAVLAGCERESSTRPARIPETVVVSDDLTDARLLEVRPRAEPQPFIKGCDIVTPLERQDPKPGDVIVRCLDRELFVRFNCRGLDGEANAISFVVGLDAFRLHCQ